MDFIDLDKMADVLRSRSVAWKNAKYELDNVQEVRNDQVTSKRSDPAHLERVLVSTYNYVAKMLRGGLTALASDKFIVDYDIRCDMDRPARYGAVDCLGMSFIVDWQLRDVKVRLGTGESTKINIPSDLKEIVNDYWNLRNVLQIAYTGQVKITRLVKGCLMYLDHLGKGPVEYRMPPMATMKYCLDDLEREMHFGNRAYVFSDQDSRDVSNWILYSMCEEYPHPVIGGVDHVSIPADADHVILVGYNPEQTYCKAMITAQLIWDTLILYANNFGLRGDLERALAIACSLRQNRYLSSVALPRVVSWVDMIYPVLGSMREGISNTILDLKSSIILGRVHQMLIMLLVKDLDVSVRTTTTMRGLVDRTVISMLFMGGHRYEEYIEDKSVADILKITAPMLWIKDLGEEGLREIRKHSVFEGFWLLKYPKQVFRGGLISNLKKGMKYPIRVNIIGLNTDSVSILMNDVVLGGGPANFVMPDGAFNVSYSCMRGFRKKATKKVLSFKGHRDSMSGIIKDDGTCGWEEKRDKKEDEVESVSSGERDDYEGEAMDVDEEEVSNLCQNLTIREA